MTTTSGRVPPAAMAFAAIGWLLAVVGAIGAVALRLLDPVPVLSNNFGFGDVALVGFEVMGVAFASVGALLVVRRPRNAVGWCMVLIGVGQADSGLTAAATYSAAALATDAGRQLAQSTGWLTVVLTTIGGLVFLLPLIFPSGRGHTQHWDRSARFVVVLLALVLLLVAFQPGPLNVFPSIENPFGIGPDLRTVVGISFTQLLTAGALVTTPVAVLAVASRYRSSDHLVRQQLKWFLLASLLSIIGVSAAAGAALLSKEPPGEAGIAVFGFGGALVPFAIGIAILRYRLYEIDRIISRTIGYALVTFVLFGTFAVVNLALVSNVSPLVNNEGIAVAASTLVVAALFNPVRGRIQRLVDRRFHRAQYDAERMVADFGTRLRDEVEIDLLRQAILDAVGRSVEPTDVHLWLRPGAAR